MDGILETEGFFKNGIQDSVAKMYHPNGKIEVEVLYKEGKPQGYHKEYAENGHLLYYALLDGKTIKYGEEYDETGNIIRLQRTLEFKPNTIKAGEETALQITSPGHPEDAFLKKISVVVAPTYKFEDEPKSGDIIIIPRSQTNYKLKINKPGEYHIIVDVYDKRLESYFEQITTTIFVKE